MKWVFCRPGSPVAIKLKPELLPCPSPLHIEAHLKCLRRCQKNCTKNLVPLAEAKFIFKMIQCTIPKLFLHSNLALISSSFADYSSIFNGNVFTTAKAVVCPLDAEDVSK
jgi:hypothetical protein